MMEYFAARNLLTTLRNFWAHDDGATAVEYAILISVMSALLVAGLYHYSGALNGFFNFLESSIRAF